MSLIGKLINTLDSSTEALVDCPYIEKTSNISACPILEPVPLVTKSVLKAFVIVLSAVAKYLLIAIT
jgi:hypothetical protein